MSSAMFTQKGGETGALFRAFDWSKTSIGPIEKWPRSLVNFASMVMEIPSAAIIFWGDDQVQIYNDAYAVIMGPRHPKYFGATLKECWPDTYPVVYPWMQQVLAGETITVEKTLIPVTRHGFTEETYFSFTFSPLRDDEGKIRGIFQPVSEVTEAVVGERRSDALRALSPKADSLDPVRDVVAALGSDPRDVPFCLLYFTSGDRLQAPIAIGSVGGDLQAFDAAAGRVFASQTAELIDRVVENAGPWPEPVTKAYVLPLTRSTSDRRRGAIVFGISPRLRFDEKYRSFFEVAAAQVVTAAETRSALAEANERAEALAALDRAKTTFFSNVSHEFRTPLTLMLGPLDDVLRGGQLEPHAREELLRVQRNGGRLLKLVNALLDFSRIADNRAQASFEPTDLAAITKDLASAFRSVMERAELELVVDTPELPERLWIDREMWEKIVLNLLSNAFKFTLHGKITVKLAWKGDGAELSVSDTGVGIPADALPRIFERFHRVEGAKGRSYEGSGIGLALVHDLVKLHGGDVRVESTEGVGSTFVVSLKSGHAHLPDERLFGERPLSSTSMSTSAVLQEVAGWLGVPEKPAAPITGASGPEAHIVLADDNADMREYIRGLLEPKYSVDPVADGRAALEAIARRRPDLVLTDVMMPELDGFGLLKALRASHETKGIPVVMLSARAGEESRVEGIERGADDYLVKPFSARELLARVGARIEIARLNEDLERRVRERTAQLSEMNQELESFSYSVSHDLRAPLRHIVGFAELLDRSQRDRLDDRGRRQLETIRDAAKRGGQLVDDLLAFSRLGRAEVRKQRVALDVLIDEVREELSTETNGRAIEWRIDALPAVDADPSLLRIVLKNLVGNAIKYTRPRQNAVIEVAGRIRQRDVEVWVRDNGVGFDMAYVDKLFGVFQRLHTADQFEGTGIGLAHVRRIVTRHGGRTWAEGRLNEGAVVHFTLPRV